MRITSLNLRGFFDWDRRSADVVAALRELDPAVILFQEDVYLPDVSALTTVGELNRRLQYPHRHESVTRLQQGRQHADYREGLGLLSRLPVTSTETLVLKHESADPHQRIVQLADVVADDGVWPLANVHLSVRDDFALQHLAEVQGILRARDEPRILGGDFNVNHLERRRGRWPDSVLTTDVLQYDSHPTSHETDDYFLVPKRWRIDQVLVSGDGLSDHRAVTVDLTRV